MRPDRIPDLLILLLSLMGSNLQTILIVVAAGVLISLASARVRQALKQAATWVKAAWKRLTADVSVVILLLVIAGLVLVPTGGSSLDHAPAPTTTTFRIHDELGHTRTDLSLAFPGDPSVGLRVGDDGVIEVDSPVPAEIWLVDGNGLLALLKTTLLRVTGPAVISDEELIWLSQGDADDRRRSRKRKKARKQGEQSKAGLEQDRSARDRAARKNRHRRGRRPTPAPQPAPRADEPMPAPAGTPPAPQPPLDPIGHKHSSGPI